MASKLKCDTDNIVSSQEISSSEVKIGAFIKDITTRNVKPLKKCRSATFKVDGTSFIIGKIVLYVSVYFSSLTKCF